MTYTDLPNAVQTGVANLSREVRSLGGRLFVFGSFAAGTARPQSDLDLAFELPRDVAAAAYQDLFRRIEGLPTVRPIDLVDLRRTTESFRNALRLQEIS